jgi:hypothetical protein
MSARAPTTGAARTAARRYAGLHGEPPRRVAWRAPAREPAYLVDVGRVTAVEYERKKPGGDVLYRHAFRKHSRPSIAHDERGQLHWLGGRYTTTSHGIEDRGRGAETMARSRKHHRRPRRNPSGKGKSGAVRRMLGHGEQANVVQTLKDAGVIGLVAAVTKIGASALLRQTSWSPETRGALAAGAQLLGGIGLAATGAAPRAAIGMLVGSTLEVVDTGISSYTTSQYLASLGRPASAQAAGVLPAGGQTQQSAQQPFRAGARLYA